MGGARELTAKQANPPSDTISKKPNPFSNAHTRAGHAPAQKRCQKQGGISIARTHAYTYTYNQRLAYTLFQHGIRAADSQHEAPSAEIDTNRDEHIAFVPTVGTTPQKSHNEYTERVHDKPMLSLCCDQFGFFAAYLYACRAKNNSDEVIATAMGFSCLTAMRRHCGDFAALPSYVARFGREGKKERTVRVGVSRCGKGYGILPTLTAESRTHGSQGLASRITTSY